MKLKNEVFPTVVKVDIPFYSDCREMFSEQKNNSAAEMFWTIPYGQWETGCPLSLFGFILSGCLILFGLLVCFGCLVLSDCLVSSKCLDLFGLVCFFSCCLNHVYSHYLSSVGWRFVRLKILYIFQINDLFHQSIYQLGRARAESCSISNNIFLLKEIQNL